MSGKTSPRQQQILDLFLKNKAGVSIDTIADALEISRTAVLQHLSTLEKDGYVREGSQQKTGGRPVRIFVLTEAGINHFPKQYAWFSELILTSLKKQLGSEKFRDYMHNLGNDVGQSIILKTAGKPLQERINILVEIMQEFGYDASRINDWEDGSHHLQALNCVYHDLAQTHKEICEFDIALMKKLLDTDVEIEECLANGGCACCFKIKR